MKKSNPAIVENFKTLCNIQRESDRIDETLAKFVEAVGYSAAVETIAAAVNLKAWDGRISPKNAEWAAQTSTEGTSKDEYLPGIDNLHPAHLDQIAHYARRMTPPTEPEETPAEEVKTEEQTEPSEGAAVYRLNEEKNGVEVIFSTKPDGETLDTLKAAGFRWSKFGGYWYAKQTPERIALAVSLADGVQTTAQNATRGEKSPVREAKTSRPVINLDGLENNHITCYGAEFAAVLRADLKARGVTGVTIRAGRGCDSFYITIKTTAEDYRSAEEAAARDGWKTFFRAQDFGGFTLNGVNYSEWNAGRKDATHDYITCGSAYDDESEGSNAAILRAFWSDRIGKISDINHYHATAENYPEFTSEGWARISAIIAIVESYNYDNSDIQTDYFDRGFYEHFAIKTPDNFAPRERMTEEERAQMLADFEKEAEEARILAEKWEEEEAERRAEEERRAEQEKKDRAEIADNITVEDLDEAQRYYINHLAGGYGKECSREELEESIKDGEKDHTAHISRRVTFTNPETLAKFNKMYLDDFDFLARMGGTGTNDPRVTSENFGKLNTEQMDGVKWVSVNCVAVYLGDELNEVINPEGFGYARYVYLPTEDTTENTPEESQAREAAENAADLPPFYFPAPVTEQAENLTPGRTIAIYQSSDWLMPIISPITGVLTAVNAGNYAQYSGVWVTLQDGRKERKVFCRDGKKTAIYEGLPLPLPESVVYKNITHTTGAVMKEYRDNDDELKQILALYASVGRAPLLDTIQR